MVSGCRQNSGADDTHRTNFVNVNHYNRTRSNFPLLDGNKSIIFWSTEFMDSSCDCNCVQWTVSNAEVKSQTCPEKSHNSWWAFEGTKENSDSAIFSHVSDRFTPFGYFSGCRRCHSRTCLPLPVRSSYHTLFLCTKLNVPSTPFGDTLT